MLSRYGDLSIFLQNGGRPPSWIQLTYGGTTHEEYLVVVIVVQNLVGIDAVDPIIFSAIGLETPMQAPKNGYGGFDP